MDNLSRSELCSLARWMRRQPGSGTRSRSRCRGHDHTHAEGGSTDVAATVTDASESSATTEVSYPLKTCVVSGEELGSMGEAVSYEHEGTVIKVCCDHCLPDVKKDPAKFVAMVKEDVAQP